MTGNKATVSKILTFSCVDGPGNRLVIFLQGCNFKCKNCHNPHTIGHCNDCGDCVSQCPTQALSLYEQVQDGQDLQPQKGTSRVRWDASLCSHCDQCLAVCPQQSSPKTRQYSVAEMLAVLRKNSLFINGITVTGGEATLQLKFITALFTMIKSAPDLLHLTCMVDSNGSLSSTGWQNLLPVIDGAMIDLKAWQQETHLWLTGRNHHRVFQSIELLARHQKLYEVRLLYIPGITDFDAEIDELAGYLNTLPTDTRIKLNAFQHHGVTGEAQEWAVCLEQDINQLATGLTSRGVKNLVLPAVYV
ncbi:YjjW family glycine radical enzyme activase [Photobacterium lipolyticum]|uniref:YjjW family glycine radical enzyme activase n=1 Tax=Photobacterium lipolyticum TaxID=266810 RepID=A0A2T3N1N8_9GAMM|nr:YjjW family glycine radical enzyme activase [Photobacterium lipolyticum]PSW06104.1 YjjW family glycine radical enzyme activase [Photobacterium lipolyticum]